MTYFQELGLAPHWWWLIAGALLAILEIFLPGIFMIWIAMAAAATGIVLLLLPDLTFPLQAITFVVLACSKLLLSSLKRKEGKRT